MALCIEQGGTLTFGQHWSVNIQYYDCHCFELLYSSIFLTTYNLAFCYTVFGYYIKRVVIHVFCITQYIMGFTSTIPILFLRRGTHGQTGGHTDRQGTHRQTRDTQPDGGHTDRHGHTNRQGHTQTDRGQTDRQTGDTRTDRGHTDRRGTHIQTGDARTYGDTQTDR
jgi:hypothetical protein